MAVCNPQKTVCPEKISWGGTTRLNLSFDVLKGKPGDTYDLVLAMDRSGSMGGCPMEKAIEAAKNFVRTLFSQSSTGTCCDCCDCQEPGENRIGLLSFSDCAEETVSLTRDWKQVLRALDGLSARGNTNHREAFLLAGRMLETSRAARKILVLFTDGPSNQGRPNPAAEALKCRGVEIYCIGLGVGACVYGPWISEPKESHGVSVPSLCQLDWAFQKIAAGLQTSEALQIRILEQVAEGFRILSLGKPSRGRVVQKGDRTIEWILENVAGPEHVTFSMELCYRGDCRGQIPVNERLCYEDSEGNCLVFPNPSIEIYEDCRIPGDLCPDPECIPVCPCQDMGQGIPVEARPSGQGRVVRLSVLIRDVCPNKALGVAVLLSEVDRCGKEQSRGMKVYEVPARHGEHCEDVLLDCVQFVVPESGCRGLCSKRCFRARVLANYLDTDFKCCEEF